MKVLLISEAQQQTAALAAAVLAADHQLVSRQGLQKGYAYRLGDNAVELVILSITTIKKEMLKELHLFGVPVVVFAEAQGDIDTAAVINAGVSAYVVNGFKQERISAVIELAQARYQQVEALRLQLYKSRQELEERKEIDRAKGIIMKQKGCDEEGAYQALRKAAMDQNRRIADVARNIINLSGLLV